MDYQLGSFILDLTTIIVLVISAILFGLQISKEHKWNRRKAAQDLTDQMIRGEILKIRRQLDKYAKFYDQTQTYQTAVTEQNKQELDYLLKIYLSYFEGVALGIKHNIYDENIVFDYMRSIVPEVHRWSRPFIEDEIQKTCDITVFAELSALEEKWRKKNKSTKKS